VPRVKKQRDDDLIGITQQWLNRIADLVSEELLDEALSEIREFRWYLTDELESMADRIDRLERDNKELEKMIREFEKDFRKQVV
jgi:DNA repair exonuclease SbcCD ATPase subunit